MNDRRDQAQVSRNELETGKGHYADISGLLLLVSGAGEVLQDKGAQYDSREERQAEFEKGTLGRWGSWHRTTAPKVIHDTLRNVVPPATAAAVAVAVVVVVAVGDPPIAAATAAG